MVRPRTSDEAVLKAAVHATSQYGTGRLTLAAVASEAGLPWPRWCTDRGSSAGSARDLQQARVGTLASDVGLLQAHT